MADWVSSEPRVRQVDFSSPAAENGVDIESTRCRWGNDVLVKCRGCEVTFPWPHDFRGGKDMPNRHELKFCPNCGKQINLCFVTEY